MDRKEKIFNEAKETIGNKQKLKEVISRSSSKLKSLVGESSEWKELKSKVDVLIAMVQAHISGRYRAFSNSSLLMIVFALIYFITPMDVIPDFVPALGFTDDASVLYLIYRKLSKDIDKFTEWTKSESKQE